MIGLTERYFQACASDPEDFNDVLAYLNSRHSGNLKIFSEGCKESLALHDLSQKDEEQVFHKQRRFSLSSPSLDSWDWGQKCNLVAIMDAGVVESQWLIA